MNLSTLQHKLSQHDKKVPDRTLKQCRDAGFDAGKNGANRTNCHFSFFESAEKTQAWEDGNDEALKLSNKSKARAPVATSCSR